MVIKFRAWNKYNHSMYYDVQDAYDFMGDAPVECFGEILNDTDEWVVMQYTGLKDKNGEDIHEDDIVKSPCGTHKVIFVDGGFCLDTGEIATDLYRMIDSKGNHLEVIGNIYENPELLNENKGEQ